MSGYFGPNRDPNLLPGAVVSPFDRKPIERTIAFDNAKLASGVNTYFADYCGWVFIEDDGGCSLRIQPGRAAGPFKEATSGRVIWIGDGHCRVTYTGMAPVRDVRLIGCTADDARVYGSTSSAAKAADANTPNETDLVQIEIDGTPQTYSPPAGTLYTVVTLYDDGTTLAVGTDATVPVNVGPSATLISWTHYGTSDIFFQGVNAEFVNFTNYLRV